LSPSRGLQADAYGLAKGPTGVGPLFSLLSNARLLARPADMPPYATGETWAIDTWWAR
jgi:microcin C transport system substrate-binding protein